MRERERERDVMAERSVSLVLKAYLGATLTSQCSVCDDQVREMRGVECVMWCGEGR